MLTGLLRRMAARGLLGLTVQPEALQKGTPSLGLRDAAALDELFHRLPEQPAEVVGDPLEALLLSHARAKAASTGEVAEGRRDGGVD
ncbi:hypothetical protein [Methylobacterium fujisawaense]|uniref:hypothetical protein n=1 Tax=Methylobacterium fujisawaense TaxID=107400 RepID=UPI0037B0F7EC